jgi:hypothetical protein
MDHTLKGKWHSYLIQTSDDGSSAQIQKDGADHVMDLSKMKESGDLDEGTHNGKKIHGKAKADGSSFFLKLEYDDGTRTYEGYLVRDKIFGSKKVGLVSGRFIFLHSIDDKELIRVTENGFLTTQEEGTWVITRP